MYRRAEQTHLRAGHRNQRRNTTDIPNITEQMIRQVTRRNNVVDPAPARRGLMAISTKGKNQ
jgi:hypothetical protein